MDVTPQQAETWLAKNVSNRPISRGFVALLANAIARGEWQYTHQGIAFDVHGNLIDGQHRLAAIVKAGVPVRIQVSFDVDPAAFSVVDTGRKRNARDVLALRGEANSSYLASALRVHHLYTHSPNSVWSGASSMITNEQIVSFLEAHPDMRTSVELGRAFNKSFRILVPAAAVGHYLTTTQRRDIDQNEWVEGLITGANLEPFDPRLMLRNVMLRFGTRRSRVRADGSRNQLHLYLKAWNGWVHGAEFRQLNIKAGESMPTVTNRTSVQRGSSTA
ncbi:hypothetical protein [Nocardia sp. NPDC050718]|uniref:hypothetical protein n=1 Tax=Nocardia sp. NPDC050718 TaxID=3155788 RepID=UPI0034095A94